MYLESSDIRIWAWENRKCFGLWPVVRKRAEEESYVETVGYNYKDSINLTVNKTGSPKPSPYHGFFLGFYEKFSHFILSLFVVLSPTMLHLEYCLLNSHNCFLLPPISPIFFYPVHTIQQAEAQNIFCSPKPKSICPNSPNTLLTIPVIK